MLSFREKLCYNEENKANENAPPKERVKTGRKEVEGMKYRWMMACLCACLVLLGGCASRTGEEDNALPRQEVELEAEESQQAPEPEEADPEASKPEEPEETQEEQQAPESGGASAQPEGTETQQPAASAGEETASQTETSGQTASSSQPAAQTASSGGSFSQQQKQWLETFQTQMDQAFNRKVGTIVVAQDNQGKKSLRELDYDVTNAYDKEGETVENAEIEADLTTAQTMQTSMSYGSGDREVYERYSDFRKAKEALMTPLLEKGVKQENLTDITQETNEEGSCITLVFDAAAVRKYQDDLPSDLCTEARMQLDASGELVSLTVEQYRVKHGKQEGYCTTEYTFR